MKTKYYELLAVILLFALSSCQNSSDFNHQIETDAKSWTDEQFDQGNEKFTFAIFSDLTGG